jgi:hypothetical protein
VGSALLKIETAATVKSDFQWRVVSAANFIHNELVLNDNQYFKLLLWRGGRFLHCDLALDKLLFELI